MLKKFTCFVLLLSIFALCTSTVHAADSASASGYGYEVNGSVNDSLFTGSITGKNSNIATATIVSAYYYDTSGNVKKAPNKSGSPYITYSVKTQKNAWKWKSGVVVGTLNNGGGSTKTRVLYN